MQASHEADIPVRWVDAGCRMAVVVHGQDAVRFVEGFTTAALSPLAAGAGTPGFFADAKGQVLALAAILRTADGVWIDGWPAAGPSLAEHLERYHIRESLEIADVSTARANLVVVGPGSARVLESLCGAPPPRGAWAHGRCSIGGIAVAVAAVDWAGPAGFLIQMQIEDRQAVVAALETGGIAAADPGLLERLRIERGWPAPADILPKTLPQELGHDHAISFTKGCYLGQETVARLDALGHVNRRLVGLVSARPIAAGAEVTRDGAVVGTITSATQSMRAGGWLGLAILPVKAGVAGTGLEIAGGSARPIELPLPAFVEPLPPSARGGEVVLETPRFRVVRIMEPGEAGAARMRDVVEHPGSVVVVPLVSPGEVCLVEVVRVAVGRTLLELPAGTLDRVESPAEAAARELAEETGYRAGRITSLGGFWMSPGILRERMHLFVAEQLVPGPQALEPGEQIRTRVVPLDEAVAMCRDGRIDDAKTVAGLLRFWAGAAGQVPAAVPGG